MSFTLKTTEDGEYLEETITITHDTKKIWSREQLIDRIIELTAQIEETQERRTVLEEQLERFKK